MGQKQEQKDVARQDDATQTATGNSEGGAAAAAEDAKGESVTRADVEKMIGDAVAGLGSKLDALASKIEPPAAAVARTDGEQKQADPMVEAMSNIAKSVESVSESVKASGEHLAALTKRIDALESATVVRNDATDGKQTTQRKDTFAGIFDRKPSAA